VDAAPPARGGATAALKRAADVRFGHSVRGMSRVAARLTMLAVLAALVLAVTAAGGASASRIGARPSGVVPHAGTAFAAEVGADNVSLEQSPCTPPLCWVMRTNTTYAIYWSPSDHTIDAGYESDVSRYLTDVAAASGSQTNVYSVATQYYDSTGFIAYQSKFGGSDVDTDPFPANGCSDAGAAVCLTDGQLQDEIQKVVTARGWSDGPDSLFFIFTGDGVDSCFDSLSGQCAFEPTGFCAYHSGFTGTNNQPILYANEPYDATVDGCAAGPSPNNDDADATLNTVSHEQNESITDPWGNGWLNSDGDEIADICAWDFGTPLGTAADGQPYNQLINGHEYALQEDYSNDGGACRARYIGLPANTQLPALSGVAAQKHRLSASQGAWTQLPTAYAYQWLRCGAKGTGCAAIARARSATYKAVAADGGHTLEVRVSARNARGTTHAVSKRTATVVGVPASRKAPRITGRVATGRRLTAVRGTWSGPPKTYRFQWLRCSAAGSGSCVQIGGATRAKYKLTKRDARHRIRVRVTAVNAAGTKTATSRSTARVAKS
jgi:hypothetical protein